MTQPAGSSFRKYVDAIVALASGRLRPANRLDTLEAQLEERTAQLSEALDYQTATSDVLKVMSRSAFDLEPVLRTVCETAARLCDVDMAGIWRPDGKALRWAVGSGNDPTYTELQRGVLIEPGRGSLIGRVALERRTVEILDAWEDPDYEQKQEARIGAAHSMLGVPLLRDGALIGIIGLARKRIAPFTARQVELVETFADQSVIAIENVRLFQALEEKSRQLEIASRHKSEFLANMSHELRTPLNAVLGYTELMVDGVYGVLPDKAVTVLDRVQANGKHLLALINDVLDLSKIEAGQLKLATVDYALRDIVQTVAGATESLAAAKQLALVVAVAADLPIGHGDEQRITQVLLNLVGNAIKFTETGNITIRASVADDCFTVSVSDTGPGIEPDHQQRIFDAFQQVDGSSTRKKGGTGLGLSISRRIVELHGGRIWVESIPGQGSTFSFSLPVRLAPAMEST